MSIEKSWEDSAHAPSWAGMECPLLGNRKTRSPPCSGLSPFGNLTENHTISSIYPVSDVSVMILPASHPVKSDCLKSYWYLKHETKPPKNPKQTKDTQMGDREVHTHTRLLCYFLPVRVVLSCRITWFAFCPVLWRWGLTTG